jgi:hypothetical protein
MRNIVVGVIYPGMEKFLSDYAGSINSQTTKDFELFLFDNQFGWNEEAALLFERNVRVEVIPVSKELSSIVLVRKLMVEKLLGEEGVSNVIFTDTDDFFDKDRFKLTLETLEQEEVVFTDVVAVDREGKELGVPMFLENVDRVFFKDLIDKNMLGFSHTAIKWKCLKEMFPYKDNLIIGDWWLFAGLLSKGLVAKKVEGTFTYYRQYGNNIAGMKKTFSEEEVWKGIEIKIAFYENLLNDLSGEKRDEINGRLRGILRLKEQLSKGDKMQAFLRNLNKQEQEFYWWEHIDSKFLV